MLVNFTYFRILKF